ncbi:MAG: chloride channel protein, partial [Oscillospiraceae bacterium]|nr:chloride channel protein [Oscillospiraceae bacterium]
LTFLKWVLIAAVTGGVGGFIGMTFHVSVEAVTDIRLVHGWTLYFLPLGGIIIVALYKLCNFNKGTDAVISSIRTDDEVPAMMAPLIYVSTVITHLLGGSAGREGAALQIGGSIGSQLGKMLSLDEKDMHLITMCGMSGVFAALFGTPLTATFFALEVTSVGIMYYSGLVPCIVSSLTAYAITVFYNIEPTRFTLNIIPDITPGVLLKTALIAVLCAELSIIFCTVMHKSEKYMKRLIKNDYLRIVIGGVVIIGLTYLAGCRDYNGAGMSVIRDAAVNGTAKPTAFLWKIIFTAVTIAAGYKGGEIVPTFFIGATFGCVVAGIIGLDPGFGAAVGMVAMFCGVLNCPIASIILSVELFGAEGIVLFAITAGISYMLSGYYGLYGSQKIMYSKLKAEYINQPTK